MIPVCSIHINTNLIDKTELSSNWHANIEAELIQKYYLKGVQMGATFADYIERKKTGMNCVKRMVWQNDSGCNVTSHNIRPERKEQNYARQSARSGKILATRKLGQGAKC